MKNPNFVIVKHFLFVMRPESTLKSSVELLISLVGRGHDCVGLCECVGDFVSVFHCVCHSVCVLRGLLAVSLPLCVCMYWITAGCL